MRSWIASVTLRSTKPFQTGKWQFSCHFPVICQQVAEALGLDFYFTNAVTQEYKLTGFIDANGNYQETQFYKAFTKGGLFFLDEMDASIPETLIILNAAIANRYYIKLLDWLEAKNIVDTGYSFHIHSMNPVGVQNMRTIIKKNEWREIR